MSRKRQEQISHSIFEWKLLLLAINSTKKTWKNASIKERKTDKNNGEIKFSEQNQKHNGVLIK